MRITDLGIKHLTNNCKEIVDLNLSGCKNLTDKSLQLIANTYKEMKVLNLTSIFGFVGVTDLSLEVLSKSCSCTLTTLDVNGCIGIKRGSKEELLQLFPNLRCFKVHS